MTNPHTVRLSRYLHRASKGGESPIWKRLSKLALKPTRARRTVNLNRIASLTRDGDVVVVPGKVLATGGIGHGITISAFGMSEAAAGKIAAAGGSVISFEEMVSRHPTGRKVALLG